MDLWTVIVQTPDGPHTFRLPEAASAAATEALIARARQAVGCPDDWFDRAGWDVSIAPGEPHPRLVERATAHDFRGGQP